MLIGCIGTNNSKRELQQFNVKWFIGNSKREIIIIVDVQQLDRNKGRINSSRWYTSHLTCIQLVAQHPCLVPFCILHPFCIAVSFLCKDANELCWRGCCCPWVKSGTLLLLVLVRCVPRRRANGRRRRG